MSRVRVEHPTADDLAAALMESGATVNLRGVVGRVVEVRYDSDGVRSVVLEVPR